MLDLDAISAETLLARGKYSTVRGAHKRAIEELVKLCGNMQSLMPRILKEAQSDSRNMPNELEDLVGTCQLYAEQIERVSEEIESLAAQRAELKKLAW